MRLLTSIIAADLVVGLAVFPAGAAFEQVAQAPPASTPPAASSPPPASTPAPSSQPRQLGTTNKVWKGDFDRMLERRMIRVLVPYSRTLFFNDKGRERGVTAELVRRWEQYINKKYAAQLGKRPVTIYMVATTRDKLIPQVAEGLGDIAAGNITVTEARLETVDFVAPEDIRPVNEIVVAGPKAPPIKTTDDLSGATVHVRRASSYYESLQALNERFAKEGKPPVKLVLLPDALEDEDAHGDGQRGCPGRPDRRRLEGHHLGAGPPAAQGHSRGGGPQRRPHGLGPAQGQPQARRRADGFLHERREEAGRARGAARPGCEAGEGDQEQHRRRGAETLPGDAGAVPRSTVSSTTSTPSCWRRRATRNPG